MGIRRKAKLRETQYKVLNAENKNLWLVAGRLTLGRKEMN